MKRVVENSQVAHLWAHQAQGEARSGNGNFWFEGLALYSYRTKIAQFTTMAANAALPAALVTSRKYSVTTSNKHMPALRRALPPNMTHYFVPHLGNVRGELTRQEHVQNGAHLLSVYVAYAVSLRRAHNMPEGWQRDRLESLAHDALTYHRDVIGDQEFARTAAPNAERDWSEIVEHHRKRDADPKRAAKLAKRAEERRVREAEAARIREGREREARTQWLAGQGYWRGTLANGCALLRVRGDVLETSQGASVPLAHAIKAFRMVKRCKDAGAQWHRNGHTIRVGHFQVDSIDAAGNMIAGCHRIAWDEIERIAREVGVFDADTSEAVLSDVLESTAA